jgi:ABC-type transport system substrate-binding protein
MKLSSSRILAKTIHYFRTLSDKEKIFLISLIVLGFVLAYLFGFSQYAPFPLTNKKNVFIEGVFEKISTLNPIFPRNQSESSISMLLYPPLFSFYDKKSFILKNFMPSQDKLSYFLEIDKNKKWSDGTSLSIDDIDFSFQLYKSFSPKSLRDYFKNVDFEIINETSGVFKLKFNDNLFEERLSQLRILPSKWWRKFSQDTWFSDNLEVYKVGFFYQLYDWKSKDNEIIEFRFRKNDYLKETKNSFAEVIFKVYPDYIRALHSLLKGEIDALANVKPESLGLLSPNRFNFYNFELPKIIFITFNKEKIENPPKLNINFSLINQKVFSGYAFKLDGVFSPKLRKILGLSQPQKPESNSDFKESQIIAPEDGITSLIARLIAEDNKHMKVKFVRSEEIPKIIERKNYEALLIGIDYGFPPNLPYFWSKLGLFLNNKEDKYLEKQFQNLILEPQESLKDVWLNIEEAIMENGDNIFLFTPPFIYVVNSKINISAPEFLPQPAYRFIDFIYWR